MYKSKFRDLVKISAVIFFSAAAVFTVHSTAVEANADVNYHSVEVTSDEISSSRSVSRAIQNALDEAKENATDAQPYRIVVAPGTYQLFESLRIYSNTDLVLDGVTFTQDGSSYVRNMLKVGDGSDISTGYFYKNITVENGVFDESGNSSTAIKAVHAQNFTLKNVTVQNVHNSHLMEVAGIDGLNIENCTFKDQLLDANATPFAYEAIQLDIPISDHIVGYRSEALQTKNVKITGSTFDNVPRGVGSHTTFLNVPFDNISITNCKFSNISSCAIQGMNWINCTISGNTITKPSNNGINVFNNSTAKKIVSNKISSGKGYGIAIYSNKSKAKLKSNKIKSCKKGSTNL